MQVTRIDRSVREHDTTHPTDLKHFCLPSRPNHPPPKSYRLLHLSIGSLSVLHRPQRLRGAACESHRGPLVEGFRQGYAHPHLLLLQKVDPLESRGEVDIVREPNLPVRVGIDRLGKQTGRQIDRQPGIVNMIVSTITDGSVNCLGVFVDA